MIFLPIVARELRVAARRRITFWTRTGVALGAIAVGVFLYLASLDAPAQSVAQRIFIGLVVLAAFFCLFAGRRSTADCLSEEKRQGTLGLLFLTDLKGYDIVFGKLAATSLNGFYGLLAVIPVLAVPILMGGITNGEFWRVALVLANTFLFSLSIGIFVSALSHDARRAMGANLLLLLFIGCIPGGCAAAIYFLSPGYFYPVLLYSCPLYSLYLCVDSVYRSHQIDFWCSVVVLHIITWALLGLAARAVRYSWQDKPAGPREIPWRAWRRSWNLGPASTRTQYRTRLLNTNAFYWLAARARFKPLHVWGLMVFVAGWWAWARIKFGTIWLDESTSGTNIATAIMLNVALKLWVGLEASHQLAEARHSGAFELLLSTPLTVSDIVRGQWLALRRHFLGPAVFSALVAVVFMVVALYHSPNDHGLLMGAWLGGILLFVADIAALSWAGMYAALTTRNPNQASMLTVSRVVFAPGIVFAAILVLVTVYSDFSRIPGPGPLFALSWWLGLGLTADLIYGLSAKKQVLTRFRYLACHGREKAARRLR